MRALLIALALLGASCGEEKNRLFGSVSEVYDLGFDRVEIGIVGQALVVEYLRGPTAKVVKLAFNGAGRTITPGQDIDLTEIVDSQPRGTLQRIVEGTQDLPLLRGQLVLDQVPAPGQTLSGRFRTMLSSPMGRTLNGDFEGTVVQR